jgi:hypothetical protein
LWKVNFEYKSRRIRESESKAGTPICSGLWERWQRQTVLIAKCWQR